MHNQSNYSSRIIVAHIPAKLLSIHNSGSISPFQRHIHSKFSKMACGRLLDLVQQEVEAHDTPTPKTL